MKPKAHKHIDKLKGLAGAGILHGIVSPGRSTGFRRLQHDFMALLIEGRAEFQMESMRTEIATGPALIYVPAGTYHRYDPDKNISWYNCWICFYAVICLHRFGKLILPPGLVHIKTETHQLTECWSELCDVMAIADDHGMIKANYLLHSILFAAWQTLTVGKVKGINPLVRNAQNLMTSNIRSESLDCRWLARELGMGYDNFRIQFKKHTGQAPNQYWLEMKINVARAMLTEPGARVGETALALGFKDPYYFSRLFKKKTGIPPKKIRDQA